MNAFAGGITGSIAGVGVIVAGSIAFGAIPEDHRVDRTATTDYRERLVSVLERDGHSVDRLPEGSLREAGEWVVDGEELTCRSDRRLRVSCSSDVVGTPVGLDSIFELTEIARVNNVTFDAVVEDGASRFSPAWVVNGDARECRHLPGYAVECVGDLYLLDREPAPGAPATA